MKLIKHKNNLNFNIISQQKNIGIFEISKKKKTNKFIYKTFLLKENILKKNKKLSKGFIKKIKTFF